VIYVDQNYNKTCETRNKNYREMSFESIKKITSNRWKIITVYTKGTLASGLCELS